MIAGIFFAERIGYGKKTQTNCGVIIMANGLNDLLENNQEVNRYFSSLPANVKNAVSGSGQDICSLEDLLRCVRNLTGSC
jgi:hypothetical protein